MSKSRIVLAGLLLAAGGSLSACATDGYGYGGAYGGYGDYYDYNGGYYDGGGAYYDPSYYGWYGDYYYPGSGYYVYDRNHNRHRWNGQQQHYWQNRGHSYQGQRSNGGNWDRYSHRPSAHQGGNNGGNHSNGGYHGNGGYHSSGGTNGGHSSGGNNGGGHRGHH